MKFIKGKLLSIEKENNQEIVKIKEESSEKTLIFSIENIKEGTDLDLIVDDKTSEIIIFKNIGRAILPMNIVIVYFILFIKSMLSTISYSIILSAIVVFLLLDKTEIVNIESFCLSVIELIMLLNDFIVESFCIKIIIIIFPISIFLINFLSGIRKIIKGKNKGSLFIGNVKNLSIIRKIDTVWSYFM